MAMETSVWSTCCRRFRWLYEASRITAMSEKKKVTPEEENKELKKRLEHLEAENAYLKKFEGRNGSNREKAETIDLLHPRYELSILLKIAGMSSISYFDTLKINYDSQCEKKMAKYNSYGGSKGGDHKNYINQRFMTDRPLQKNGTGVTEARWGSEITDEGLYLSIFTDLYSGQILSYSTSLHPNTKFVI